MNQLIMMKRLNRSSLHVCVLALAGLTLLQLAMLPSTVVADTARVRGSDSAEMFIGLLRFDDWLYPAAEFNLYVGVNISESVGATAVSVTLGDGTIVTTQPEDGISGWEGDEKFSSFAAMQSALHGTWTVTVSGPSPSTSTFTMNANDLQDADIFPLPEMLVPTHEAVDVPPDVEFAWIDPTGAATPEVLLLELYNDDFEQFASSLDGDFDVDTTTWSPSQPLSPVFSEFGVLYLTFDEAGLVSPLTVTSGSLTWQTSPLAPPGYPDESPLLLLGSNTIIAFEVAACALEGDVNGDGSVNVQDLLLVISNWGSSGPDGDANGDGFVNVQDLLLVISNWGSTCE